MNLYETWELLRKKLAQKGDERPAQTSLILLSHALNQPKSWLLAHNEYHLEPEEIITLQRSLEKFLQGVPLPYILGQWDFYGRSFKITPDVLIPRPETELLVETAIQHAKKWEMPTIVDVGTGSGIIALSLAAELPSAKIIAVDISMPALQVAQTNAQRLGQTQVQFIQSNLLSPFNTKFDLICANLPYIPRDTLLELEVGKWEPHLALDGGQSGLSVINTLLHQAQTRLTKPGMILLEIEASLGDKTLTSGQQAFPYASHHLLRDLAGRQRVLMIHQE